MNSPSVCRPGSLASRDVVQALVHQFEVGGAGGKARVGGRVLAFHLAGQAREAIEQLRLLVAAGHADRLGERGEFFLGDDQQRRRLACRRQSQQGGHAIGVDLQQPLHQPAQAARRQVAGQQHHARAAVGMQREVGVDRAVRVGDGRTHQRLFMQQRVCEHRCGQLAPGQHPHVQRRQAAPRQGGQPVLRHGVHRRGWFVLAEVLGRERAREGPRHEFGVQLPADAKAGQVEADVRAPRIGQWQVVVAQQCGEVRAARLALRAASPTMTMCDNASGAAMASGGRAWISLCSATLCGCAWGWTMFRLWRKAGRRARTGRPLAWRWPPSVVGRVAAVQAPIEQQPAPLLHAVEGARASRGASCTARPWSIASVMLRGASAPPGQTPVAAVGDAAFAEAPRDLGSPARGRQNSTSLRRRSARKR